MPKINSLTQEKQKLSRKNKITSESTSKKSSNSTRTEKGAIREALNYLNIGFSIFDANQRLVFCNKKYCELYGLPREVAAPGTYFHEILEHHFTETNGRPPNRKEQRGLNFWISEHINRLIQEGTFAEINKSHDNREIRVQYSKLGTGGWVDLQEDVTENLRTQRKVSYLASHDTLTGLSNRYSFEQSLREMLTRSRKNDAAIGVVFIDLDGFKSINDNFGHPFADRVLKAVAKRIQARLRPSATLSRLGGDEFAICEAMPGGAADAASICKRLIGAFEEPFSFDDGVTKLSASFGIALAPDNGRDSVELIRNADLALYRSKKLGGNTYHFFEQKMDAEMRKRIAIENDLRQAINDDDFELFYQPIAKVESGKVSGCEALLRWNHPKKGMISPADFIPIAEDTGLIIQLGAWVIERAFLDASKWPANIRLAINISPVQLRSDEFVEIVQCALERSGIDPRRVELEITETGILEGGSTKIRARLLELKALGLRIALDDFGTGFSSLSHVHSFPIDRIKIDGSFVHGLGQEPTKSLAIVKSLTQLATSLGMETTAECVETAEQLSIIEAEGCTEIQGYYFSRPTSIDKLSFDIPLELDQN